MEIGPIFRALINHRSRFWLITLEIALTLAIVVNCLNMVLDQRAQMYRPTGLDEEHTLVVSVEPYAAEFREERFAEAQYEEDLRELRTLSGVIAATGISAVPLSGGGSSTGRKASGTEGQTKGTPYFVVGDQALETLGVRLIEGRDFTPDDFPAEILPDQSDEREQIASQNVIVTKDLADVLFPDGGALGKTIQDGKGESVETIVGIIERMHCSWPQSPLAERVLLYPGRPAGTRGTTYMVRVEPERVDELYQAVEPALLALNEGRLVEIKTLAEVKRDQYSDEVAFSQLLGTLSVLLVAVTSLGIVGLTSFSVTQRRREIGTRRALGATRLAILRYFLVENWLVTSVGLSLGLVLAIGLNLALAQAANVSTIGVGQLATAMAGLWLVGLAAAVVPALRGMRIAPVIATRNV